MSETKTKPELVAVTLPARDWVHVVNAVESSFGRKYKRGDKRAADEMELIGRSIIRQVKEER